jgi:hypothetical protein
MIVVEDGEELHDLTMNMRKNQKEMKTWKSSQEDCWAWSNVKNQIYLSWTPM